MKSLQTNVHGQLRHKDLIFFGGQYSLFEKIKLNGTGSPKIVYDSGIEPFDNQKRNLGNIYQDI